MSCFSKFVFSLNLLLCCAGGLQINQWWTSFVTGPKSQQVEVQRSPQDLMMAEMPTARWDSEFSLEMMEVAFEQRPDMQVKEAGAIDLYFVGRMLILLSIAFVLLSQFYTSKEAESFLGHGGRAGFRR